MKLDRRIINMKEVLLLLALLVALINSQTCTVTGCKTCSVTPSACTECNYYLGYEPTPASPTSCACRTGFYWDTGEKKCIGCYDKYINCLECTEAECTTCDGVPRDMNNICAQPCESVLQGCISCPGNVCTFCAAQRNLTLNANGDGCICRSGFVRKRDTDGFCVSCHYFIPGCISCSSTTSSPVNIVTCDNCCCDQVRLPGTCACREGYYAKPKDYYFADQSCVSCSTINNCVACSSSTVCTRCQGPNRYLSGGRCVPCSNTHANCETCNPSNGDCLTCIDPYEVLGIACNPCNKSIVGCVSCANINICDGCDTTRNYKLAPASATSCACIDEAYNTGTRCALCRDILDNCDRCTSATACTRCLSGFFANPEGFCSACSAVLDNCDECANSTYCNLCAIGYTEIYMFAPTQSTCEQCSTLMVGCLTCETLTVCTNCDSANNFVASSTSCECAPAYFLNSAACQSCTSFSPQCTACISSGCTACAADYFLKLNKCVTFESMMKMVSLLLVLAFSALSF